MGWLEDGWNVVSGGVKGAAEGVANGDPGGAAASLATGGAYTPGGNAQQGSGGSENPGNPADGGKDGDGDLLPGGNSSLVSTSSALSAEHSLHDRIAEGDKVNHDMPHFGPRNVEPLETQADGGADAPHDIAMVDNAVRLAAASDGSGGEGHETVLDASSHRDIISTVDHAQHHIGPGSDDQGPGGGLVGHSNLTPGPNYGYGLNGAWEYTSQGAEDSPEQHTVIGDGLTTQRVVDLAKTVDPSQHHDTVLSGPPIKTDTISAGPQEKGLTENDIQPAERTVDEAPGPVGRINTEDVVNLAKSVDPSQHADAVMAGPVPSGIEAALNPQPLPPHGEEVALNPQPLPPHGEEVALNPQPLPPHGEDPIHGLVEAAGSLANTAVSMPTSIFAAPQANPAAAELNPQPLPPHGGGPQDVVGTVIHDATRSLSGLLNSATHLPSAVAGHTGLTHDASGPVALNPQPLPPHGDPTIRTHSDGTDGDLSATTRTLPPHGDPTIRTHSGSADADTGATTRTQPQTHESHLAERVASSLAATGSAHGPEAHYPAGLSHSDPAAHSQLGVHEQLHAADHPHGLGLADHHGHDGL